MLLECFEGWLERLETDEMMEYADKALISQREEFREKVEKKRDILAIHSEPRSGSGCIVCPKVEVLSDFLKELE